MIIKSLLDTDLYKFTMAQVVFHRYKSEIADYKFTCRNKIDLAPYADEIREEIKHLCSLRFHRDEIDFLRKTGHFKEDFLLYLAAFQLNFSQITVQVVGGKLDIRAHGPWVQTIFFEVFVLSIVNEVYFRNVERDMDLNIGRKELRKKIDMLKKYNKECKEKGIPLLKLSDFGTRRRFSSTWQGEVDKTLKEEQPENFIGTSSVYWAKVHNLTPIGTFAHEFLQAFQVLATSLKTSQKEAFYAWLDEYPDRLGIALSDIYGLKPFLRDWSHDLASRFKGARHDSGDPFIWGEAYITHLKNKLKIDPLTKTAVFSDGLNIPKAIALHRRFATRIQLMFGIGTDLTNDFLHVALNIVMKMIFMNGKPVCKISDEPGKASCEDKDFLELVINECVNY